ncbi:hypothetical protein [Gloeobacter kilaueensis]|uniref:Uncharacterized protein n=1 Tax=Gloeobacter kilaueensis (strain ATCC BAA-2537 / CCAP 1431/1 / ULC 316 / JS1) TaxID=1183438 RepID=U5QJB2_GLOK1|nr:hypothetical protein [Gloeobacter kilaueensis]AGY59072.1 hypothetical protein GKIL_2826 [Gloeobacter kilaueensis JS1]
MKSSQKRAYIAPQVKPLGNLTAMTAAYPPLHPECYPGGFGSHSVC